MMLRKTMIGAVGFLAMTATAFSADIYQGQTGGLKDDTSESVSAPWAGLYLGGNLGYAWGNTDVSSSNGGFDEDSASIGHKTDGVLAGAQAGYNVQRGSFVIGVEGEIGYLGASGDKKVIESPDNFGDSELSAYGALAARLGIATDRALYYVKGGVALARAESAAGDLIDGSADVDPVDATKLDETLAGYAVGGGVEYALSSNWSVKGEYLYMNFGDETSTNAEGDSFTHEIDLHTAKVGVNYKLGGETAVLK